MGFMDEVQDESRLSGTGCKTCRLLARMDPAERAEVQAVLADRDISTSPILRALNKRGHEIGLSALHRHRSTCVAA